MRILKDSVQSLIKINDLEATIKQVTALITRC